MAFSGDWGTGGGLAGLGGEISDWWWDLTSKQAGIPAPGTPQPTTEAEEGSWWDLSGNLAGIPTAPAPTAPAPTAPVTDDPRDNINNPDFERGVPGEGTQGGLKKVVNDISGVTSSNNAARYSLQGTMAGISEMRRQFDSMQELLSPYTNAGSNALGGMGDLSGANGPEAQAAAYAQIQNSPGFQAQLQQGENSILQNASATGGLRGGNTQSALAQFSPQLLNQAINQRYSQYGGLAGMGQASAAGVGAAGMNMGQNVAGSFGEMGRTNAANQLAQYSLPRDLLLGGIDAFTKIVGAF